MQAVIETGGKQYQVQKGQKLSVEKLSTEKVALEVGSQVEFDVLAILGDEPKFGQPLVSGAKVIAKVLNQTQGEKIDVSTYKRRKGFHKSSGHRQELTSLEITDIKA